MGDNSDAFSGPIRVLVIDDEKGLLDMLSHTLRRLTFEVETAEDGERGLAAARPGGFDVVVCDMMMPGMNGLEVLEALRREKIPVEAVMVTGYPTPETAARAAELGAFDYLAKPYDLMALAAVLEKAARRKRARGL
ncbi:MAG: response regulator [Elusimicrobia bacterium]|nr:response regulator [Elusimicrobiota bacterium]